MTKIVKFSKFLSFDKGKFETNLANFIDQTHQQAITKASDGWLFSKHYDKEFCCNHGSDRPIKQNRSKPASTKSFNPKLPALQMGDTDFLSEILKIPDIEERWKYIRTLIGLDHKELLKDSFGDASAEEAELRAKKLLSEKDFNIVIIGGGCVGLYTANILKNKLGDFANILVCENRASAPRIKKPYARDWITNIHISHLQDYVDPKLVEIFAGLGSDNFIGATINSFETLMFLSGKNIGISFYFDPNMNLNFLEDSEASLIIDATGGKLDYLYPETDNLISEIDIIHETKYVEDFSYAGVHPYESTKYPTSMNLKLHEGRYYPYLNDKRINYPMFKMTKIPTGYLEKILEFISKKNQDNIFYIWTGRLAQEVNEILILVNLQESGFDHFAKHITKRVSLKEFIEISYNSKDAIVDNRIKELAHFLIGIDNSCDSIKVEPPFRYEPNIKLLPQGITRVFSKPIIPIGDSYYPGHAKVGNGLGYHVHYAMKFAEMILSSVMPPIEEVLKRAIDHHTAGDFESAKSLYDLVLKVNPNHSDANHNLGILSVHTGTPQVSIKYFEKAINSNPQIEQYWISAIDTLIGLGMIENAKSTVQQARNYGMNSDRFEGVVSRTEIGKIRFD